MLHFSPTMEPFKPTDLIVQTDEKPNSNQLTEQIQTLSASNEEIARSIEALKSQKVTIQQRHLIVESNLPNNENDQLPYLLGTREITTSRSIRAYLFGWRPLSGSEFPTDPDQEKTLYGLQADLMNMSCKHFPDLLRINQQVKVALRYTTMLKEDLAVEIGLKFRRNFEIVNDHLKSIESFILDHKKKREVDFTDKEKLVKEINEDLVKLFDSDLVHNHKIKKTSLFSNPHAVRRMEKKSEEQESIRKEHTPFFCIFILDNLFPIELSRTIVTFYMHISKPPSVFPITVKFKKHYSSLSAFGQGILSTPRDVKVGRDGEIYVADTGNSRICVFSSGGELIESFGSFGNKEGQFSSPSCLALDALNNIIVGDSCHHHISIFRSDCYSFQLRFPVKSPGCIAVSKEGKIVVTVKEKAVIIFSRNGEQISKIMKTPKTPLAVSLSGFPRRATIDNNDLVYVSDLSNEIYQFNMNGEFLRFISYNVPPVLKTGSIGFVLVDKEGSVLMTQRMKAKARILCGRRFLDFSIWPCRNPDSIAFDHQGNLLIADGDTHQIFVFG